MWSIDDIGKLLLKNHEDRGEDNRIKMITKMSSFIRNHTIYNKKE
jgi:hypothetical protein